MKTIDKILNILKQEGAVTAKQIAERFHITTMGARQHLQSLEDDGYVYFYDEKVKVGRPVRHWVLTEKGHEQFINRHDELSIQIIEAVSTLFGPDGFEQVAKEREHKTLARYQQSILDTDSLATKLDKMVQFRENEGYMVELKAVDDHYLLIENHCPICKAATFAPNLCQSELNIFKQLLKNDASIKRLEHIVSGQRRCAYLIIPLEKTSH